MTTNEAMMLNMRLVLVSMVVTVEMVGLILYFVEMVGLIIVF